MNSFQVFVEFWHLSWREKLTIVAIWVVVGSALWFLVGKPFDEYNTHGVQVMREQLALLPPPTSATVTSSVERAHLDPSSLYVSYAFSGTCEDVQSYYARVALQAGWTVTNAGVLRTTSPSEDDDLESDYQKVVEGYKLKLMAGCRPNAPAGDGYSILFNLA